MGTLVLYKCLRCGLQANVKAVIEAILEKSQTCQFFILYHNMNFYENVRYQRIFNCDTLITYTAKYICFMKPQNGIKNIDNSWKDQYIDQNQVDRRFVNQLKYQDFDFTPGNFAH